MLYLYSENYLLRHRIKNILKRLLGRKNRGPQSVEESLVMGFKEIETNFFLNKKFVGVCEMACVLSGAGTLRWAINEKKAGKIKKIVAGPNIVVNPRDEKGILKHELVDTVIVPSQWVKDYYSFVAPEIANKIKIWPAGVDLPVLSKIEKTIDFLIYNKLGNHSLYKEICEHLTKVGYRFKTINYGQFKKQEYFNLLDASKYEIYLSESESQGIAMFEAWARNVPTLVWERGFWKTNIYFWKGFCASPFLISDAGLRFNNFTDFIKILPEFYKSSFFPREYISNNFSYKIAAQKYLEIIYNA